MCAIKAHTHNIEPTDRNAPVRWFSASTNRVKKEIYRTADEEAVAGGRLEKALEFTTSMMSSRDADELLRKMAETVADEFGFEGCDAFVLDKEKGYFVLKASKGYNLSETKDVQGISKTLDMVKKDLSDCEKLGRFTYLLKAKPGENLAQYYALMHPEKAKLPREKPDDWHELDVLYVAFEDATGNIIGFLEPDGPRDGKLPSAAMVTNLEIFAALASIAIGNAELVNELDKTVKVYKALFNATAALQEPVDLNTTLHSIADSMNKMVPFDEMTVYLVDWERNLLTPIYATGAYAAEVMSDIGPISGLAGHVAKTGEVEIVEDSMDDTRVEDIPGIMEEEIRQTIMCIPLKSKAGEVEGVLEIYRDKARKFSVTEYAVAEPFAMHAAIAMENARLREELRANFESVQHSFDDMKALDRAKDSLVNTISHELRTPLTTILGYLEMASEGMYGELSPKMKDKLRNMIGSVNRINTLVSKMLEMSRLQDETLVLDLDHVNLAMVTREIVKEVDADTAAKRHEVTVLFGNDLPVVIADRLRMHDAIHTIITNAIRYTNPGGKIVIGADILGGKVHLWVKDNGIGIADEQKPRIFDRFFLADEGLVREDGRVGIGLYVSREIVRKHGGDMWFETKKDEGSTFHITIPLRPRN